MGFCFGSFKEKKQSRLLNIAANLLTFLILLSVNTSSAQPPPDPNFCRRVWREKIANHSPFRGLKLVPGPEVKYHTREISSVEKRIEKVTLKIDPSDNLDEIAEILANGRPKDEVLAQLKRAVIEHNGLIPLVDLLPPLAASLTNKTPNCRGYNCLNAAIVWHEPSQGLGSWTSDAFIPHLKKNYRKLNEGERLKFGDVIVIKEKKSELVYHAAIYLNENLAWHKAGRSEDFPWTFETIESVLHIYADEYNEIVFFRSRDERYQ